MVMKSKSNEARKRTEATIKKEERTRDGAQAMIEYEEEVRAVREKTARLRALRLAKEAPKKEGVLTTTRISK